MRLWKRRRFFIVGCAKMCGRYNIGMKKQDGNQSDGGPVQERGGEDCLINGCKMAWRSPRAVLVFLVVAVGLLAADLVIKYETFEKVGDKPVVIEVTGEDLKGPVTNVPYDFADDGAVVIKVFDDAAQPIPQSREGVVLVPKILNLHITLNTGAVFGLGKGGRGVFVAVTVVAVFVIGWFFAKSRANEWVFHLGLACILSGAIGNLYDRINYAAVRDMFYLFPGTNWYPWIFNLADAVLLLGVLLVMVHSWRCDKHRKHAQSSESSQS